MTQDRQRGPSGSDELGLEMMGLLRDPAAGHRWASPGQTKIWRPPTDVYETDDCIVVKVEAAGMRAEEFEISLNARRLTIGGVRHDASAKLGYQQMEIQYGSFETDVHLPKPIVEDEVEATYEDGFLVVHLPKRKPRHIPVSSNI
jgi:HSP20 family protein